MLFIYREIQDKMVLMQLMEREVQRYIGIVVTSFFRLNINFILYYRVVKVNKEIQVLMAVMVKE